LSSNEQRDFTKIIDSVDKNYLIGYVELPWSCWDHSQRSNYVRELEEARKNKQKKDLSESYLQKLSIFTAVIKGTSKTSIHFD
jgi:hypothetical protein